MAARENQGYLIAVIILVLLTLVLALLAFLSWSQANQLSSEKEALEVKNAYASAELTIKDNGITALKGMIGDEDVGTDDIKQALNNMTAAVRTASTSGVETDQQNQLRDIVESFEKLVEGYENDVRGTENLYDQEVVKQATYRELVKNLTALVDKMVHQVGVQIRQTEDARTTASADIKKKDDELKIAKTATESMRQELETVKQNAIATEQQLKGEVQLATENLATRTKELQEANDKITSVTLNKDKEIKDLEVAVTGLQNTIERLTRENYEIADGTINNVARSVNTVFLDLGRRDGLRVNRMFTVFEKGTTNFDSAKSKGAVEVIRIDDARSEARIVDENPRNPILAGDLVLTPTWDPGIGLRYVLIGRFDLDGDDSDDTETLVRYIERNGGEVVARQDADGNMIGKIDPTVDFFVEGNSEQVLDADSNLITTMNQMKAQAEKNTVSPIDLDKLLKGMGYQSRSKTIRYNVPQGGFKPRTNGANGDR